MTFFFFPHTCNLNTSLNCLKYCNVNFCHLKAVFYVTFMAPLMMLFCDCFKLDRGIQYLLDFVIV